MKLVEDLNWKVSWALDFSHHGDINEALDPILNACSDAEDNLQELQDRVEEQLDEYKSRVRMAKTEIAHEVLY